MRRVRIGMIGLGEVAQVVHLPILAQLADRFTLTAICDVSPTLLAAIGEREQIPPEARHADYRDLVARDDVDAVMVLNSDEYHADCAIAALAHGKDVFVEKPMCLTHREADEIIRARDAAGRQVMVGYMRRFAPAFLAAKEALAGLDRILYVRVRDILGPNRLLIDQANEVLRPDDIPAALGRDRAERAARLVHEAIGEAPPELVRAYRLLCGLNSHDLSAMRELIGMPRRVASASLWDGGSHFTATMDFGDFGAVLETGVDRQARFDAHIEVYGPTESFRIQYDTPYIRHLATTLVTRRTEGDAFTETVLRPTFTDPYTCELLAFHDALTAGGQIKTTPEDFCEDLRLFDMIIAAFRRDMGTVAG